MEKVDAGKYGNVLTSILGKRVTFEPSSENFRFADLDYKADSGTHWDVLSTLNRYGDLKIEGFSLEFWMNRRETLLKGGEFAFCVSSASVNRILREISFITGKNFLIVSGDGDRKVKGRIEGTILSEVLDSLSKAGGVTIVER
ncbi:MAG: hypothetical protein J5I65_12225 [Aridibacter famidurans]|nr:hypothetical protein [Aridibacter famidurans]